MNSRRLAALTAAVLAGVLAAPAAGAPEATAAEPDRPRHSSDGVRGPIAPPIPPYARSIVQRTTPSSFTVAPGVRYTTWDERDVRGPIRAHLLSIKYDTPGIQLDYANPSTVSDTATVPQMIADKAVAAVNGDFFDIGDTGAPLGVGKAQTRGLQNGRRDGWNSAFYIAERGRPTIGTLPVTAVIKQHRDWTVTNVNSPSVSANGIGVYTQRWGRTSGYRVTDGQTAGVAQVLVRGGKVVKMRRKLTSGAKIRGTLLVGRGEGAQRLTRLHRGDRVNVTWRAAGKPRMAMTGNRFLVLDGVIKVVDDREMHPRTAVGISRDTKEILLLVIDGRQSFSRGYTMVELAEMMIDLGADEALNLDGGGSSTMVARKPSGNRRILNSPSDGSARPVANALEVRYKP